MSGAARLASFYDTRSRSIALELTARQDLPAGWRLAFTSIVQLTPSAGARLLEQLSSYHVVEPIEPISLPAGETWRLDRCELSHRPHHANDGPVSGHLIMPDGTTVGVAVEWLTRFDAAASRPKPANVAADDPPQLSDAGVDGSPDDVGDSQPPAIVPFPADIAFDVTATSDTITARHRTVSFGGGPAAAHDAWSAVAALAARMLTTSTLVDDATADATVTARHRDDVDDEAYRLAIDDGDITVEASTLAGFRYAFVTLAQLAADDLPARVEVRDRPRFVWRGLHIDLARQWYEPALVARLIDEAAWRKLNRLHLHLTDDEGWRLPVLGHPLLAEIGGSRGHRLPIPPMYGGGPEPMGRAYSPGEIAAWNARAATLGVVLVPEVDLPGHMHAALTALPHLRDPDDRSGATSVQFYTDNVLVPGHEATTPFLTDVFHAVAELFPSSPWIHIGGDEVAAGAWEGSPVAQRYRAERGLTTTKDVEAELVRDVAAMVRERHGRAVGAWEEAADSGGVRPGDGYVVGWRTVESCRSLAARGYDVVVAPGQAYYLDMAPDDAWSTPGASWAATTTFEQVCTFDPTDGWSEDELTHLVGIQACLWSEHIHDETTLERLLFPRLDAVAERAWTGKIVDGPGGLRRRVRGLCHNTR